MKTMLTAGALGLSLTLGLMAAPALAQDAPAAAAGALSVEKTPISDLVKNEKAKAVLEAEVPGIAGYYDQIGAMTLAQVAPMSQGALDDAKLKAIQTKFDAIK